MRVNQSNLSNPPYGYDLVVATTQESIDSTMKEYLYYGNFPVVKMYWNQDANGNAVPVSYEELMTQTNGADPLTVSSWDGGTMPPEIENINKSNFYFAFEAAIGIPPTLPPQNIPDIVTLQSNSQSVLFNLICYSFTVVSCNFSRNGLVSFTSVLQPDETPWLFTSNVLLKNIFDNTNLPRLIYQPLYDLFGTTPPNPSRLMIPNGVIANDIAACRKSDLTTDLYVFGNDNGLYYFAAENQTDRSNAVLLAQYDVFKGVRKIYAHQSDTTVIVWGINANNEIFYVTCPVGQITAAPSQWTYPLPIMTNVDMFTPYLNRVDDGNTFFAVADNILQKRVQSTSTSIWTSQSITLDTQDIQNT